LERRLWWRQVYSKTVLAHFTEHCATWGMALFSAWSLHDWRSVLSYGIAAGMGLALLDAAFRAHRARFATAAVPFVFRGIPLDLITAGLMALALYGFVGF
jgi:electron transport complex protein RnfA